MKSYKRWGVVRWLGPVGLCLGLSAILPGCVAHARGTLVYDHEAEYVDAAPERVEYYPHTYYRGEPAYLVDGRWYYHSNRRWVVFHDEPPELREYRVRRAPAYLRDNPGYAAPRRDEVKHYEQHRAAERRADARRYEERRAAQHRAEVRRQEEHRAAERRAAERRAAERRAEAQRADMRRMQEHAAEQHRAEERRAEKDRRTAERRAHDSKKREQPRRQRNHDDDNDDHDRRRND
jgi:hypothetical protein